MAPLASVVFPYATDDSLHLRLSFVPMEHVQLVEPAPACPKEWAPQTRPDETGTLHRVATVPAERERFGTASVHLDGRLFMAQPLADVRDKTLEIAFWAKGENGAAMVRLFEYTNAACSPLDYLADVTEVRTDGEWREYRSLVTMWPCHGAAFAKIELHGRGVLIDNLRVTPVETGPGTGAATVYRGTWSIPLLARPPVVDGRYDPAEWASATGCSTGFMSILTHAAVARQTEVRVAADATTLYLLALFDVRPNGHKNTVTRRDGNVWEDESLEVILCPEFGQTEKPAKLYQLVLNLGGTVFDLASQKLLGVNQPEWTCEGLQVRPVGSSDHRPGLEIAIPFAAVGIQVGRPFGINLGNFLPCLLFGNHRNGLCWYADSDRGWTHDESVPCTTISREKGVCVVRLHIVAKSATLRGKGGITFGLIATPTRPRVVGANLALKVGDLGFGNPFVRQNMGLECRDLYLAHEKYAPLKASGTAAYLSYNLKTSDVVLYGCAWDSQRQTGIYRPHELVLGPNRSLYCPETDNPERQCYFWEIRLR